MLVEDNHPFEPAAIVARLLNSPLRGCEFLLRPGRTLFLVGPGDALADPRQLPELPGDTLYVPLDQDGINFEILVDDAATIRELGSDEVAEYPADFNQVLRIGGLELALRPQQLAWLPEILSHPKGAALSAAPAPDRRRARWWPLLALTLAVVATGAALLGGAYDSWSDTPQRQTEQLAALLGRDAQRFQILPGHDGQLYVVANNERDRNWAQQALLRGDFSRPPQVIGPRQENDRLARWLADKHPELAYFRLQLRDPRHPQLWISQQRAMLIAPDKLRLNAQLAEQLPYADQVELVAMDDAAAASEAEAGLARLALPFRRDNHPDSVTFVISGTLEDGELQRARQFIDGYYRQWGSRYVQFAIELKDDWLKGKSFMNGSQGYVKMDAGHWYFPKPL
ncbi:MxiG protein [Chromobacterium vaccinii]|nr:MxiG protein [Chromobacterium vaccinii]QND90928.1 MxiG protein [Chromobacterium vaccinii]